MNSSDIKQAPRSQQGAATVEAALTMVLFLMLLFGIMEFAMLIYRISSLAEATRAGARYLIVNDPVPAVNFSSIDCSDEDEDNHSVSATCADEEDCPGLVPLMQSLYEPLQPGQVHVQYRCSSTGFAEAGFDIYEVEVSVQGAQYSFVTPGILGLEATVTLPDFATTRLSEDLHSITPE